MTADKFAKILAAAASGIEDVKRHRILEQLLYHAGRVVYLLDAMDDLPEDIEKDGYNPCGTDSRRRTADCRTRTGKSCLSQSATPKTR